MTKAFELTPSLRERWRMGRELGKGGQGKVYLLQSTQGAPDAVLKVLLKTDEYTLERFRREVQVLASISHPNVMRVIEHGTEPSPFYVAPKGEPLHEYWARFR